MWVRAPSPPPSMLCEASTSLTTSYWNSCNFSAFEDAEKRWKHGDHRPPPTHGSHNLHPLGHTQGQRHRPRGPRDHQTSPRVGNHLPGAPRCVGREERRLPVTQETRGSLPLRTATLGHTPQRGGTCPASRTRRVRSPHGPPSIGKAAWDPGLTEGRDPHPWGSGQAGKASGSHPENRGFKSRLPYHSCGCGQTAKSLGRGPRVLRVRLPPSAPPRCVRDQGGVLLAVTQPRGDPHRSVRFTHAAPIFGGWANGRPPALGAGHHVGSIPTLPTTMRV